MPLHTKLVAGYAVILLYFWIIGARGIEGCRYDVTFVLDGSGSVGQQNFIKILGFVKSIVADMDFGPEQMRVGVVEYSNTVTQAFNLLPDPANITRNRAFYLSAIDSVSFTGGETNTHLALDHVRTNSFASANGNRAGVSDMAILVTDGASLKVSDTNVSALNLRNAGVRIVVVGVESDPPLTELRNIASDPDSQNVFVTDSFDNMGNISIAIRNLFRVDGGLTRWSNLSSCSQSCGNGTRSRIRSCSVPAPACGGTNCTGQILLEIEHCGGPCPVSDPCLETPCYNGGTCERHSNFTSGFNCTCAADFGGTRCQERNCSAGEYIHVLQTTTECRLCTHGSYQPDAGQFNCLNCSNGYTTSGEGNINELSCRFYCQSGYEVVASRNTTECLACAQGFYKDNSEDVFGGCLPCNTNVTTLTNASVSRDACYLGKCPAGQHNSNSSDCKPCPKGTYQSNLWQISCKFCPHGYTTEDVGQTSQSSCKRFCGSGYYLNGSNCNPCSIGYYKNNTESPSTEFATSCTKCSEGFVTPGFASVSADACFVNDCPPGTFIQIGQQFGNGTCSACPEDTFQPLPWKYACNNCQRGFGTNGTGKTSSGDCIRFCPSGREWNGFQCVHCDRGYYKDNTDNKFGFCILCPEENVTVLIGSTSRHDCRWRNCTAGSFVDPETNTCIDCPKNTYQDQSWQTNCRTCPDGRTTDGTGKRSISDCLDHCQPGTYSPTGHFPCESCRRGLFQERYNRTECERCLNGTSTPEEGATNRTQCIAECPKGQYSSTGLIPCGKCEIGKYQPFPGNTECIQCPRQMTTSNNGSDDVSQCIDKKPPTVVLCPSDITKTLEEGQTETRIDWAPPTVEDNVTPVDEINITSVPEAGSVFKQGATLVKYTIRDSANNVDTSCKFHVKIQKAPVTECRGFPSTPRNAHVKCTGTTANLECKLACNRGYTVDKSFLRGVTKYYQRRDRTFGSLVIPAYTYKCWKGEWIPRLEVMRADIVALFCYRVVPPFRIHQVLSLKVNAECENSPEYEQQVVSTVRNDLEEADRWIDRHNVNTTMTTECQQKRKRAAEVNLGMDIDAVFGKGATFNDSETVKSEIKGLVDFLKDPSYRIEINGTKYPAEVTENEPEISCEPNQMNLGDGNCANCPPGTFFSDPKCSLCPANTYQDQESQSLCIPCPGESRSPKASLHRRSCVLPTSEPLTTPLSPEHEGLILSVGIGSAGVFVLVVFIVICIVVKKKMKSEDTDSEDSVRTGYDYIPYDYDQDPYAHARAPSQSYYARLGGPNPRAHDAPPAPLPRPQNPYQQTYNPYFANINQTRRNLDYSYI